MPAAAEKFHEASDGAKIFVRTFLPEAEISARAVLFVHHGLGEHSGRYIGLADFLTAEGFVVVVHDARGHGQTSKADGSPGLGRIACGPEGAVNRMVLDWGELIAESRQQRPGLPHVLLGHSFGSVIARLCVCGIVAPPPQGVVGVVLCSPPARVVAPMAAPLKAILGALHMMHGDHGISEIPTKLSFDKFQAKCLAAVNHQGPVTGWEWLNRDKEEVQKYVEDDFAGHFLSMGFWKAAVPALLSLKQAQTYAAMPPSLPICVLAGEHDFCTIDDFGTPSYTRIQQELAGAGKETPKVVVYPKARHELLLEINAAEVRQDVLSFFLTCLNDPARRSKL